MAETGERGHDGDALARSLGWFSIGLGAAQLAAPAAFSRAIGVANGNDHARLMRAMGLRELGAGVGILTTPKAATWFWSRLAGDALDLALLAAALRSSRRARARVAIAIAAVAGATAADAVEATRLSRTGRGTEAGPNEVKKSITVNKAPHEVYDFWRDFENFPRFMTHLESVTALGETRSHWVAKGPAGSRVEWDAEIVEEQPDELISWRSLPDATVDNEGTVRFRPAPHDRGTEIHVELRYSPPGGVAGALAAKISTENPAQQLHDDLRRFKQVIETGDVVRSEGTPEGDSLVRHLLQRAARPLDRVGGGSR